MAKIKYIEFGYTLAEQFWSEVVLSAYERFKLAPNRQNAIHASVPAWHVVDWLWHEEHPGEDTRGNPDFENFQKKIINDCPELTWIRDVAEAGKHRGLGRKDVKVRKVKRDIQIFGPLNALFNTEPFGARVVSGPLTIVLDDGTTREFSNILSSVINYWKDNHFRKSCGDVE